MTLNVAHGRGQSAEPLGLPRELLEKSLDAVASVVNREKPDVLALQEIDGPSFVSGGFDHFEHIRQATKFPFEQRGFHFDEGIASVRFCYGTGILSKLELLEKNSKRFVENDINFKGFVAAQLDFQDRRMLVVSVHMNSQSPEKRAKQAQELIDYVSSVKRPTIICGDLNSQWPNEKDGVRAICDGLKLTAYQPDSNSLRTFPAPKPTKRLDWILVSPEFEITSYRALPDFVSDHFAVIADVCWKPSK